MLADGSMVDSTKVILVWVAISYQRGPHGLSHRGGGYLYSGVPGYRSWLCCPCRSRYPGSSRAYTKYPTTYPCSCSLDMMVRYAASHRTFGLPEESSSSVGHVVHCCFGCFADLKRRIAGCGIGNGNRRPFTSIPESGICGVCLELLRPV